VHNEELHDLYSASNTIRVIKSRRMRWAGHGAHMVVKKDAGRVLAENPKRRDHLEDLRVDGRIILK
jgi:hypothetical protein